MTDCPARGVTSTLVWSADDENITPRQLLVYYGHWILEVGSCNVNSMTNDAADNNGQQTDHATKAGQQRRKQQA